METFSLESYFPQLLPLQNFHILSDNLEDDSDILAIFLSLDAHHFNLFYQAPVLLHLFDKYLKKEPSFRLVLQTQYSICLLLSKSNSKPLIQKTLQKLAILKQNQLINGEHFNKIENILNQLALTTNVSDKTSIASALENQLQGDFFNQSVKILSQQSQKLLDCDLSVQDLLNSLLENLQTQKFSLGITGVLSAGKSTFLNALLGQEVLGTSTIPETANLTILKYAQEPYAQITFWNTKEWEEIQNYMDEETKAKLLSSSDFQSQIQNFIAPQAITQKIAISDLPTYTSANHPSKLCNLIKQTTLFTPLVFLENNVEIVDTPGLDDPIILREEITKSYIQKCDLLIHTMNASQAATQIDIDFILETLQTGNIARILILLTHIDLLSKKELEGVLNYTQQSIRNQLLKTMPNNQASLLLKRLDFIPLASYPALLTQTNPQKAKELGYTYEDSNFPALLNYLENTLLGSNSTKAKDIIFLTTEGFSKIAKKILEEITLKQKLLFSTQEEIKQLIKEATKEREIALKEYQESQNTLQNAKAEVQDYLHTLQNFLTQKLKEAQNILAQRIFDDIIYDFEKNKTPNLERLENILAQGLKDFLVDILRSYGQNLNKKITQIQSRFENLNTNIPHNLSFNQSNLNKTQKLIFSKLQTLIKNANKSQKNSLLLALQNLFIESFGDFENLILTQSKLLEENLIKGFQEALESIYLETKSLLDSKDEILQNALKQNDSKEIHKEEQQKILSAKHIQIQESLHCFDELKNFATRNL